jgi:hypothetical protein
MCCGSRDNGMPRPHRIALPLRIGLVAATLLLAACGLTASGIAVTSILRHSLIKRVDQNLEDASHGWAQAPLVTSVELLRAQRRARWARQDGRQ